MLGVTVDGSEARVALLDAVPPHTVIDQSRIDLTGEPTETLVSTLVSTDRMLAQSGHRLVGTSVCSSYIDAVNGLRDALVHADLTNVTAISRSDAVTAVTRSLVAGETTASLVSDGDTAALSIVDSTAATTSLIAVEPIVNGDRGAAYRTLLERFSEEPGGATSVIVLGGPIDDALTADLNETSPVPVRFADEPEFALARGAALAGFRRQPVSPGVGHYPDDSLDWADTMLGAQAQQLAYSQVDDAEDLNLAGAPVPMQTPLQPLSALDPEEYETEEEDTPAKRPRALLLGSTVAAVVVVGFAALAVSVALNIRPEVNEQPVRIHEESVAGKYFPVAPGQGVNPDGPVWTMVEEVPQPGTEPDGRVFRTQMLASSRGTGDTGAEVIKMFRDGTVGVIPNGGVVTPAVGGGGPVGGFPQASEFLTRLIPDFSRWSPCQVLALVSNMRLLGQTAVGAATSVTTAGLDTLNRIAGGAGNDITDVTDLGTVVLVRQDKGTLFPTTENAVNTSTDLHAIPTQIFETGGTESVASNVLPSDTKIIDSKALESLATTGGPGETTSVSILDQVIPHEVGEALPGTQGTAPVVDPGQNMPDSVPGSSPNVPDTELAIPGVDPGTPLPGGSTPPVNIPGTPPLPNGLAPGGGDAPALNPEMPQLPSGHEPKIEQAPIPTPEVIPTPPVEITTPKVEAPAPPVEITTPKVEAPAPPVEITTPKVEAPAPPVEITTPKVEAPAPPVDIPVPQAPVVPAPVPSVQAPTPPVITLPKLPIPTQFVPAPSAPEPEAPAEAPSAPAPTLPKLPSLGGLFGSGSS